MDRKKPKQITNLPAQLEIFLNNIPGSVYWKNKEGVYLGCNDAVLGKGNLKTKDDIIGKTDHEIWPTHADAIRKVDLEVMRLGQTIEREEIVALKNGEVMYFSSVKSPLKDEEGNIVGVIGNSLDITELKIQKQNAEIASLAKTQFLALISHEIRIPLTGILSSANLLVESDVNLEDAKELGKIIENSGRYLLSTIDDILDFAKLESNKFQIVPIQVNLKSLIDEVTNILKVSAEAKGLKLTLHYEDLPLPKAMTDSRVLRHILANLISNAIKYTEQGFIHIKVCHKTTKRFVHMNIAIRDTGIGIPSNKLDYIFDRFAQVDNAYMRKQPRQGTGLGLSIARKLSQQIDGDITVESQLNVGSTFYFTAKLPKVIRGKK